MKNILKKATLVLLLVTSLSCENDEQITVQAEGGPQLITPLDGSSYVLEPLNASNEATTLVWNHADYSVQTEVNYEVQVALSGTDFADFEIGGTTTNRFLTWIVGDLNLLMLNLGVTPNTSSDIDVRIKSSLGSNSQLFAYSNTIKLSVTAYGCLGQYAVGAGIPSAGWGWDTPLGLSCDEGVLTAKTDLINDAFRFFTVSGDWNSGRNYPYYTGLGYKIVSVLENAGDGDSNFRFTGTPGSYRIKIDENQKFISLARSTVNSGFEPTSTWLVGAATPGGWSWAGSNETELPLVSDGIFEVPIALNSGEAFRVFLGNNGGDSWDLGSRNFPWYVTDGYTIDSELENANDGDSNFRYTGPSGLRLFKVNSITKTITVD